MHPKLIPAFVLTLLSVTVYPQEKAADTVIIPLAESSKIIFTLGDPEDLRILRHYDFQALFNDVIRRLEDSKGIHRDSAEYTSDTTRRAEISHGQDDDEEDIYNDDHSDDRKWDKSRRGEIGQSWQSYNIDLGTNNYLASGQFPNGSEPYAVRPWGSWYIAGNSVRRTRVGNNVFVEWGLGVSWYTFKFQEDNIRMSKDDTGVYFDSDDRDVNYIKSKLSATFINASLVPVLDFGGHSRKPRVWDSDGEGFRFGAGPYVGYRIGSKSKLVYEIDDDRKKEKDHDSYYLNNLRYGLRVQIGVRSTDLFINYDMNELFAEGKGPKLNAVSFGLIF